MSTLAENRARSGSIYLENKVAVVTGGTGVLGTAFCEGLALEGAHVVVVGRRADVAEALALRLERTYGREALAAPADVLDQLSLVRCRDKIMEKFGRIDVLVNGAGGNQKGATVSPDGSLCASGGKDGTAMLWDLNEGKRLYSLDAGDIIHSLVFSPNRYWLCAATTLAIKIWDLESKVVVDELKPEFPAMGKNATAPYCTSICWSADGAVLYSGYTDGLIRAWHVGA